MAAINFPDFISSRLADFSFFSSYHNSKVLGAPDSLSAKIDFLKLTDFSFFQTKHFLATSYGAKLFEPPLSEGYASKSQQNSSQDSSTSFGNYLLAGVGTLLLLPLLPLAVLSGCGSDSDSTEDSNENPSPPPSDPNIKDAGKVDAPPNPDAGQDSDGGDVDPCNRPYMGPYKGTSDSPYTFKVLVMVDTVSRDLAIQKGWNVEEGVQKHFDEINSAFNNGQLENTYDFVPMDIQYRDFDMASPQYPPHPQDTPEDEDFLLIFNEREINNSHAGNKRVILASENSFSPLDNPHFLIAHEFGHLRGAIDLYTLYQGGQENLVFPGAGYSWDGKSYMATGTSLDRNWDALTKELFMETGGDSDKSLKCAWEWLSTWAPPSIKINVKNESNIMVPNATIDVYRRKPGHELKPEHLWFSGTTNSEGMILLPMGITETSPGAGWIHYLFLTVVRLNNESYLNWFTILDVSVPYRKGVTELILEAKVNETTHYQIPQSTDLEAVSVSFIPSVLKGGEVLSSSVIYRNLGQDNFSGRVGIQFYLSQDSIFDSNIDLAAGGTSEIVSMIQNEEKTFSRDLIIPQILSPGDYFLIFKVESKEFGTTDPNLSNNVVVSQQPFTVNP